MSKINNIEDAITAIESAGYVRHECWIIEQGSYVFSMNHAPYLCGFSNDEELFEFARKVQLKAFW